jgi:hypothetical protein
MPSNSYHNCNYSVRYSKVSPYVKNKFSLVVMFILSYVILMLRPNHVFSL